MTTECNASWSIKRDRSSGDGKTNVVVCLHLVQWSAGSPACWAVTLLPRCDNLTYLALVQQLLSLALAPSVVPFYSITRTSGSNLEEVLRCPQGRSLTALTMAASVASHLPWSTCLVSRFVRESPFVGNPSYIGNDRGSHAGADVSSSCVPRRSHKGLASLLADSAALSLKQCAHVECVLVGEAEQFTED